MIDVAIIGGGISGLCLAYYLKKHGLQVVIIEAKDRCGGVIETVSHEGFILENGPNTLLSKQTLLDLIAELELTKEVVTPNSSAKDRFLVTTNTKGELCPLPRNPIEAFKTPLLSTFGKLRFCAEPLLAVRDQNIAQDISVSDFFVSRFGAEITNEIVAPVLNGIWAANISKLSLRSAFPKLWELKQNRRSVLLSMLWQGLLSKRRSISKTATPLTPISFKSGLSTLTEKLQSILEEKELLLRCVCKEIKSNSSDLEVFYENTSRPNFTQSIKAKKLVITCESNSAANIISSWDLNLSREIKEIYYSPLKIMHLAFKKSSLPKMPSGFGFLVAPSLKSNLLGAIFSSSLFPERSPSDEILLTCFVGGELNEVSKNISQASLTEEISTAVTKLLRAEKTAKVLLTTNYPQAIPRYPLGHYQLQDRLRTFSKKFPRISFLVNWDQGISLTDRITEAKQLAEKILHE